MSDVSLENNNNLLVGEFCERFREVLKASPDADFGQLVHEAPESVRSEVFKELLQIKLEHEAEDVTLDELLTDFSERETEVKEVFLSLAQQSTTQGTPLTPETERPMGAADLMGAFESSQRYEMGREFARGGMGAIRVGHDPALRREVAVKMTLEARQLSISSLARFIEEAQVTGQLEHPGIVPVHDIGIDADGSVFYVMKLVQGRDLQLVLSDLVHGDQETTRDFPLTRLLSIFTKVCDAVAFAHSRGVIHRDLKPANIMIGDYGEVLVMDWGLAKIRNSGTPEADADPDRPRFVESIRGEEGSDVMLTIDGAVMGSWHYMAPEQAQGDTRAADERSDVFALGAILYEFLSLSRIHAVKTRMELEDAAVRCEIDDVRQRERPSRRIPESVAAVTMKALARDPEDRYQSVEEMQGDVQAYLNGFATSAESAGFFRNARLFVARHKAVSIATGIALAVLAVVVTVALAVNIKERNRAVKALEDYEIAEKGRLRQARITSETLSRADFLQASRYSQEGKTAEALAHLARSVRVDPGNKASANAIVGLLLYRTWPKSESRVVAESFKHARLSNDTNRIVYSGKDGGFAMVETESGKQLYQVDAPRIGYVQIDPTGTYVATSSADSKGIWIWRASDGKKVREALYADAEKTAMPDNSGFSSDGRYFYLSASGVGSIWEVETGKSFPLDREGEDWVTNSMMFLPDHKRVIRIMVDEAQLWEFKEGKMVKPLSDIYLFEVVQPRAPFSSDGNRILISSDDVVQFWDPSTGERVGQSYSAGEAIFEIALSPNESVIGIATESNKVLLLDAESGEPVCETIRIPGSISDLGFSAGGNSIIVLHSDEEGRLVRSNWTLREKAQPLVHEKDPFTYLVVSSDARKYYVQFPDGQIVGRRTDTLEELVRFKPDLPYVNFGLSGEGVMLTVVPAEQSLPTGANVWDLHTGKRLFSISSGFPIKHFFFHPSNKWYYLTSDQGESVSYRVDEPGIPSGTSLRPDSSIVASAVHPKENRIAYATNQGGVVIYDFPSGDSHTISMEGSAPIRFINFDPAGERIFVTTTDSRVFLFDASTCEPLFAAPFLTEGAINQVAIHPDRNLLCVVSGSPWSKGAVRTWDLNTGQATTPILDSETALLAVSFDPSGSRIAIGDENGDVQILDVETSQRLLPRLKHGAPISALLFESSEKLVVVPVQGSSQMWHTGWWSENPEGLADFAEATAGRRINPNGTLEGVPEPVPSVDFENSGIESWFLDPADERPVFPNRSLPSEP